jgi:hypothetical protein
MVSACEAPSCGSPATHRIVLRARAHGSDDGPNVLLCPSHAGTLRFSLVTEVLCAAGLELLAISTLTED